MHTVRLLLLRLVDLAVQAQQHGQARAEDRAAVQREGGRVSERARLFWCVECGGDVRLHVGDWGVMLPTCERCGETYTSPVEEEQLDRAHEAWFGQDPRSLK